MNCGHWPPVKEVKKQVENAGGEVVHVFRNVGIQSGGSRKPAVYLVRAKRAGVTAKTLAAKVPGASAYTFKDGRPAGKEAHSADIRFVYSYDFSELHVEGDGRGMRDRISANAKPVADWAKKNLAGKATVEFWRPPMGAGGAMAHYIITPLAKANVLDILLKLDRAPAKLWKKARARAMAKRWKNAP